MRHSGTLTQLLESSADQNEHFRAVLRPLLIARWYGHGAVSGMLLGSSGDQNVG